MTLQDSHTRTFTKSKEDGTRIYDEGYYDVTFTGNTLTAIKYRRAGHPTQTDRTTDINALMDIIEIYNNRDKMNESIIEKLKSQIR